MQFVPLKKIDFFPTYLAKAVEKQCISQHFIKMDTKANETMPGYHNSNAINVIALHRLQLAENVPVGF